MAHETPEHVPRPFPLSWPPYIARRSSYQRRESPFFRRSVSPTANRRPWTLAEAREAALKNLRLLGARDIIVSSSVPTTPRGGFAREGLRTDDPGAAVWFRRSSKGPLFVIANDTFLRPACNLRAIAATVEYLRGIERIGSTTLLEQAFAGFAALPPGVTGIPPWRDVLQLPDDGTPIDLDAVERAYRRMLAEVHEDLPEGDHERHVVLNEARRRARAELDRGGAA